MSQKKNLGLTFCFGLFKTSNNESKLHEKSFYLSHASTQIMRFTSKLALILSATFLIAGVNSCKYEKQDVVECTETEPSWNGAVKGIIAVNCAVSGCHLGSPAGGFPLDSYEAAKAYASGIVMAVKHESDYPMPKGRPKLKDCEIEILEQWAALKCPLNPGDVVSEPSLCDTSNVVYEGIVSQILNANCATPSCHSGDPAGGFSLDTYESAKENMDFAMPSIRHDADAQPMPKYGSKLDTCLINILQKWIDNNYPKN